MQAFRSFHTAERTLEGVESLHMMKKGQVKRLDGRDAVGQARFVASLFPPWLNHGESGRTLRGRSVVLYYDGPWGLPPRPGRGVRRS